MRGTESRSLLCITRLFIVGTNPRYERNPSTTYESERERRTEEEMTSGGTESVRERARTSHKTRRAEQTAGVSSTGRSQLTYLVSPLYCTSNSAFIKGAVGKIFVGFPDVDARRLAGSWT